MFVRPRSDNSHQYPAVTPDLVKMSEELETLGGGDARVGHVQVHCRVCPAELCGVSEAESVISCTGSQLNVRDPHCPVDMPASQSVRRFKVTGMLPTDSQFGVFDSGLGKDIIDWFIAGFNATVIAFGQAGTGKTYTLHGPGGHAQQEHENGLIVQIFTNLFQHIAANNVQGAKVGLSCWELRQNETFDLFQHKESEEGAGVYISALPGASLDFSAVEVRSVEDVKAALAFAHDISPNWADASPDTSGAPVGEGRALPNVAHSFVRITLFSSTERRISTLNLVDLVGAQSLAGNTLPHQGGSGGHAHDRDRRVVNQQLLAFSKVISELSQRAAPTPGASSGAVRVISARDSKLTQMLSPMLAGNSRTFLIATVSQSPKDYLDTCNTMRIATRAQSIATACMRTLNIPGDYIEFTPMWRVLSAARAPETQPIGHHWDSAGGTAGQWDLRGTNATATGAPSRVSQYRDRIYGSNRHTSRDRLVSGSLQDVPAAPFTVDEDREHSQSVESDWHRDGGRGRPSTDEAGSELLNQPEEDLWNTLTEDTDRLVQKLQGADAQDHPGAKEHRAPSLEEVDDPSSVVDPCDDGLPQVPGSHVSGPQALSSQLSRLKAEFRDMYQSAVGKGGGSQVDSEEALEEGGHTWGGSGNADAVEASAAVQRYSELAKGAQEELRQANEKWEREVEAARAEAERLRNELREVQAGSEARGGELESVRLEARQLRESQEAVLSMLQAERENGDQMRKKVTEAENEVLEQATSYEVKLEGMKMEAVAMKSKCRQLQAESTFQAVFDKYEHEIAARHAECAAYKEEVHALHTRLAKAEKTNDGGSYAGRMDEHDGFGQPMVEESKLRDARAKIKRLEGEREELKRQLLEAEKRDRLYELHKRNAEDGIRRVNELKKALAAREQELMQQQLGGAQMEGQRTRVLAELQAAQQGEEDARVEAQNLRATVQELREQLRSNTQRKRQDIINTRLPVLPSNMAKAAGTLASRSKQPGMLELARRLQREVTQTTKVENLLNRLLKEIEAEVRDKDVMAEREAMLLAMLSDAEGGRHGTENMRPNTSIVSYLG
ncbi:hypothetical protein CYMTET_15286 [Cymbomonas tetramitiformis]|uniref:Kinesin motor domain-containing protein n=1 Tax=Cymbomonas tetramitiformis TaxID=36881 RepID=A0AAE0L9B2_9CHLO|nr:hypothetical protein CYMTET_15286 [Cymbomonas tetramitiformis]|eukprot:gene9666-11457_t